MSKTASKKPPRRDRGKNVPPPPPTRPWWMAGAVAVGLLAFTLWAWAPRPAPEPHVTRGNELYRQGLYADALGEYESAPGAGPRNAGVHLDRGLARYRVSVPPPDAATLPLLAPDASVPEGLTQAQEEMRTAARGGTTGAAEDVDAFLRARAAYDLGNTFFTQRHWDNAIDAYKESLRLRPAWNDAAWNLELARRMREQDRTPPDASPDATPDASDDAAPPDAGDGGNDASADGGSDGGGPPDGGRGDGGSDGGSGDAGSPEQDAGGNDRDAGSQSPDAGAPPDAAPPRSMAPLDALERSSRSLQHELLRRQGQRPRNPDDDR
jgi:tetratricopeptide (TPR) repeat protein